MIAVIPPADGNADTGCMDPVQVSPWSSPATVAGFVDSPPNERLLSFARAGRDRGGLCAIDVGCGAGRNLVPLARQGWTIIGVDLSRPMLEAAAARVDAEGLSARAALALAPMDVLPAGTATVDLIVAQGIWNLARSGSEFRSAVREAARVARKDAGLFVFTFSRRTLPPSAVPVAGETFVFTGFSGRAQCFLTEHQLVAELGAAGFIPDAAVPLLEHNVPRPGAIRSANVPVIFEAAFRFKGARL